MARPTRARVDLAALRHNLREVRALATGARIMAVVKANGYGHGALQAARALEGLADGLGVACLEEARELRESGIRAPILLMEGVFSPDELPLVDRLGLAQVVHGPDQLAWLGAASPSQPFSCWVKVDTGMHRLGFGPADLPAAWGTLSRFAHADCRVLMTHFARADETDESFTASQMARFAEATAGILAQRSLANSAAVLAWPEAHADWVRPGIMLYGASPLGEGHPSASRLRPVMTLESALIAIREVPAGEAIGYGGRFLCDRPTRVGVVAIGYADGYPRHAPDGTAAAVCKRPSRLIGRVSMDMITVDLTEIPEAKVGDPVELWGHQVPANQVAESSGTIAYQLFTGVSRRVPRVYEDSQVAA